MICVIGNKLFIKLNIGNYIDKFDKVVRCNMALPVGHNGAKFGDLALCSHLYENLFLNKVSDEQFKTGYPKYKCEDVEYFLENFDHNNFESCYYSKPDITKNNNFLRSIGCPHSFAKQPRTGYVEVMRHLMAGEDVAITHFTIINNEVRDSWYVKKNRGENPKCHDGSSEISILRWLHKNDFVDASLCLLKDTEELEFYDKELLPTNFMLDFIV